MILIQFSCNLFTFHLFCQKTMPTLDPRIDAYIEKSAPFAQPILHHLRKLIHQVHPDIKETIKWGFAFFEYKGPLCNMAAFKQHCTFGFWKSALLRDPEGILQRNSNQGGEAMGNLGRITTMDDLPADSVILTFICEAVALNEAGVKVQAPKKPKAELVIPHYFMEKLNTHSLALAVFEKLSYSHKREYLEWITEAKTEETRNRRMETTLQWLSEGKVRNWKSIR